MRLSINGDMRPLGTNVTRSKSAIARAVFKELRRAGYATQDLLDFINELMDLITGSQTAETDSMRPVLDGGTGAAQPDAILEVLAFDFRRSTADRREGLAIMCFSVAVDAPETDSAVERIHATVYKTLRKQLRALDAIGRLDRDRYLLVLPKATAEAVPAMRDRLLSVVDDELKQSMGKWPRGLQSLEVRALSIEAQDENPETFLKRCLRSEPTRYAPRSRGPEGKLRLASTRPSPPAAAAPQLVLALGGGAARAAAHIGALRALREAGITVGAIAGTSAGSIVGAMHALGIHDADMLERFQGFQKSDIYQQMRRTYAASLREPRPRRRQSGRGFLSHDSLFALPQDLFRAFIEYFVGPDRDLSCLRIPLVCNATDIRGGRSVTLAHGSVVAALMASCAVPGLFPPQAVADRLLVDGSTVSEVPVSTARERFSGSKVLAIRLDQEQPVPLDCKSSEDVAVRISAVVHSTLVREQLSHADFLVCASVEDVGWIDFRRADKAYARGYDATRAVIAREPELTTVTARVG